MKIFYSWQSDLPNRTNRGFIEDALERAAKAIRNDDSLTVEPVIDRDTSGIPGAPNIAATILEKIEQADIFVADVSTINAGHAHRPTPNPNVLLELGYALKCHGVRSVILVQNVAYGGPELLPFDLKMNRVVTYSLAEGNTDKAHTRLTLSSQLEAAIRLIVSELDQKANVQEEAASNVVIQLLSDPQRKIELNMFIAGLANRTVSQLDDSGLTDVSTQPSTKELERRIQFIDSKLDELVKVFVEGAQWAEEGQIKPFCKAVERIATSAKSPNGTYFTAWTWFQYYPALRLFYAGFMAALANDNMEFLRQTAFQLKLLDFKDREIKPAITVLNVASVFADNLGNLLRDRPRHFTPGSDYLHETLRSYFSELLRSDIAYTEHFDRCEYLISLLFAKVWNAQHPGHFWTPVGSYIWRDSGRCHGRILQDIQRDGSEWLPIKAGIFQSVDEVNSLITAVEKRVDGIRGARGIF